MATARGVEVDPSSGRQRGVAAASDVAAGGRAGWLVGRRGGGAAGGAFRRRLHEHRRRTLSGEWGAHRRPLSYYRLRHVAVGEFHACGITYDGQVRCWGLLDRMGLNVFPGLDHFESAAETTDAATRRADLRNYGATGTAPYPG